ncbi:MAG: hypothetical protein AAF519_16680 [Bacteroidota bacterium]
MKKAVGIVVLMILLTNTSFSQIKKLKFVVKDTVKSEGIPYANLGILGKPFGSNADARGIVDFTMNLREITADDQFVISCIGYESLTLSLNQLLSYHNREIALIPKIYELSEVVIKSTATKKKILGKNENGAFTHSNIYSVRDSIDDGLSKEFGVTFNTKHYCSIMNYNVFFSSNRFDKVKFRINIYQLDDQGVPVTLLNKEDIFFEVSNHYVGWVTTDLLKHNVAIEGGKFGVTAQIIETQFSGDKPALSIPITTPSLFNGFIYRDKNQDNWIISKSANPSIYLEASCAQK